MKQNRIILIATIAFIGIIILLLLPKRKLTEQELMNQWKPRDFYYIYQMWTDKDLQELREQYNEQR